MLGSSGDQKRALHYVALNHRLLRPMCRLVLESPAKAELVLKGWAISLAVRKELDMCASTFCIHYRRQKSPAVKSTLQKNLNHSQKIVYVALCTLTLDYNWPPPPPHTHTHTTRQTIASSSEHIPIASGITWSTWLIFSGQVRHIFYMFITPEFFLLGARCSEISHVLC
jgi:hypothetical protein